MKKDLVLYIQLYKFNQETIKAVFFYFHPEYKKGNIKHINEN